MDSFTSTYPIYNPVVEFAAELQASLEEFTASGIVEVRENGRSIAPFSGMSWEVRGAGDKPLLHLWSEQFNLTRRVLAITDHSEHRLALAVELFGRSKPDRLEFIRTEFYRGAREPSREEIAHRLAALDPQLSVEIYEHDPALNILEKIDPRRAGNLDTWLVPHRESERLLEQARAALDAIIAAAPQAMTLHPSAQSREVWLHYRGLPFARWDNGDVFFGINDAREELTPASRPALKHLLHDLEVHRHPLANDTRHSLYRAQPERWLESIVREDVTRIDALFDQRFVYAQVLANAGSEHGILDLLTVTRSGRLVIIELKTSEHIHLPLQAADYWLRVRW